MTGKFAGDFTRNRVFDPDLHSALKLKALATSSSMTELVNQAVRQSLTEDAEDIAAFEERQDEPLVIYAQ